MKLIKKYFSILVLLSIFPLAWAIGKSFITELDTEIYSYIPQESDIVIEINSRNFISEIMYQRIYNEDYVVQKIEVEETDTKTGIDYFSKVILFREAWADENIWIALVGFTDKGAFKKYVEEHTKDAHVVFGDHHAIIQLSKSSNQAKMDEHLKNIANKNIKPFTARVDLQTYFKADQEINLYLIPQTANSDNQLIDGFIGMDFHQDHIDIEGEFNAVSGFTDNPTTAYPLNEDAAISLRSSLNLFNSLWWFSKEKIENVPSYRQMALDYDGVNIFLCDKNLGYQFPFKTFPQIELKFDLDQHEQWFAFMDTITAQEKVKIDTTTGSLITEQGAFFQYELNEDYFQLSRKGINFISETSEDIYFDFQMKIAPLLSNCKFAADEDNPPSDLEVTFGLMIAEEMIEEMRVFEAIEEIRFKLQKGENEKILANGKVQMKNREGQSIVESMFFMTEALLFVKEF